MALADVPQPVEQHARLGNGQEGAAEFAVAFPVYAAGLDLSAELLGHHLLAIADAEDGEAAVEYRLRRARAAATGDRCRFAREDDTLRLHPSDRGLGGLGRADLAIHSGFHP